MMGNMFSFRQRRHFFIVLLTGLVLFVPISVCAPEMDPASFLEQKRRGGLQLKNKDFLSAIETFNDLFAIDPTDAEVRTNLVLAYNAYGVDQIHINEYLAAIYYLQKAAEIAPEKDIINQNLAVAYFHLGQQQEADNRIDEAILSYQSALDFNPDLKYPADKLGMIYYNRGAQAYKDREYTRATDYLKQSLHYRTHANVYIYHLLGRIAYLRQESDIAHEYWERALEQPDITEKQKKAIEEEIRKSSREKESEDDLKDYRSDKFIIKYNQDELTSSAYKVNSVLLSAYRIVGRYFNHFPSEKITVLIYNAEIFKQVTGNSHGGIRALYDGKIRLPAIDDKTDLKTFKSLLWHEYTHALIYEIAGPRCPVWLNEGLAQIQEDSIIPIQTPALRGAVRAQTTIPFQLIFAKHDGIPKDIDVALFYQQSYSMTRYLLKRYQLYKVKKILSDLKTNKPVEKAFQEHLYLSVERFETKWLKTVHNEY